MLFVPAKSEIEAIAVVLSELVQDTAGSLVIEVEKSPAGSLWCAKLHGYSGYSVTPWGSMRELAKLLVERDAS